jgi:predicted nucleic acid-binding protein
MLCVANVLLISAIWWLTRRVQRALADAETRVAIQAWHLRLMVPEEARHAVRAPTVRSGRVTLEKLPVDP